MSSSRYDEVLKRTRPVDPTKALVGAGRENLQDAVRSVRSDDPRTPVSDESSVDAPTSGR